MKMHNVRCETCGKVVGVITDEKIAGKRIYKAVETAVFGDAGAFIDGRRQGSGGIYCTEHDPQSSASKVKDNE